MINADGKSTGVYTWEDFNVIKQKWYLNNDRAINWVDGRLARLQISIDVTERKIAENALQNVNDELEQRVAERTAELARKNELLNREATSASKPNWKIERPKKSPNCAYDSAIAGLVWVAVPGCAAFAGKAQATVISTAMRMP